MDLILFCIKICLICVCASSQSFKGELCLHQKLNSDAKCKLISDCPSALEEVKRGSLPQTCGFKGSTPIVCCVESTTLPVATTATTPSSTTTTTASLGPPPNGTVGIKSYKMCRAYAKPEYANAASPLPGFPESIKVRSSCVINSTPLIIWGPQARPKEFPHMAAVGYDSNGTIEYQCAGSLISERFVLTAAHCIYSRDLGPAKYVRLGDLQLNSAEDDAQPEDYSIIEAVKHPDFRPPSFYNDLALLKLDKEVTFNNYVRPICLPDYRNHPDDIHRALATGWDKNYYLQPQTELLLKVNLQIFKSDECNAVIEKTRRLKDGIVDDLQICAGLREERLDACQSDSGGPLQIYHQDPQAYCMYMLIGITSLPKPCGIHRPGIYTRVSNYLEWIENIVWS